MSNCKEISIDGVKFVREDSVTPALSGKRIILVLDRGWIFAGDVEDKDGRIILTRAVHVFSWAKGGFSQVVEDPKEAGADLRRMSNLVDTPSDSELFRVPVCDSWGL
jgi:hypothetical protein